MLWPRLASRLPAGFGGFRRSVSSRLTGGALGNPLRGFGYAGDVGRNCWLYFNIFC
jgi:hypothetical protein